MADPVEVTITLADDALGDAHAIAERARGAGMTVTSVLGGVGVITGTVDPTAIAELGALAGVRAVERSDGFEIAPPDAPVQ